MILDLNLSLKWQKNHIRNMEFRYVEESDPEKQYLLEFFTAISLETPYNDFKNH